MMQRQIKGYRRALPVTGLMLVMAFIYARDACSGEAEGEQLYLQNCLVCHGDDGRGAMPGVPDLHETRGWLGMPEQELLKRLKNGIQTAGAPVIMPPKGGNPELTDAGLMAVITYMRNILLK